MLHRSRTAWLEDAAAIHGGWQPGIVFDASGAGQCRAGRSAADRLL